MSTIGQNSTSLSPDTPITLFEVDATHLGGSIEYGTTCGRDVSFGDQIYKHYSAKLDGFAIRDDGESNNPTVQIVPNVWLQTFIREYDEGRGAMFRRIRTFRRFLDDGDEPDVTQIYPVEFYLVERLSHRSSDFFEWELSNVLDLEGVGFPVRRVLADHCDYKYRRWNPVTQAWIMGTCPYAGASMWDRNDDPTSDPSKDFCAYKLSGCKIRFNPGTLPFRGFPGTGRVS